MKQIIELLLPAEARAQPQERRAQFELLTSLAAPFLFMPIVAASTIFFKQKLDFIDGGWFAIWFLIPVLLWLVLRITGAVQPVRDLYSLAILLFAGAGAAYSGGLQSSLLIGLCVLPIENMISGDRRRVVLSIVAVLVCLALLTALDVQNLLPADRVPEEMHRAMRPLAILFVMFYSFLAADTLIRHRAADEEAIATTEYQYESLFEMAPIAMLEQDWSGARKILNRLPAAGSKELNRYLAEHKEVLKELAASVKTLRVNQGALSLYGAQGREELLEHFSHQRLTDEELTNFRHWIVAFAAGLNGSFLNETASRRRRGGQIYVRLRSAIVPDNREDWARVITTVGDVSDRKRTELALNAAKEEADRANKAKSRFLASMSHELRTPLNAIIGFSEIMYKQMFGPIGEPRYIEYAQDIHGSGQHLLHLINDMLDLSRIEAGKYEMREEWLCARELFDWVLNMTEPQIIATGVEVNGQVAENLPFFAGDRRAMRQIMLNLLSNSLKFTPRGNSICLSARLNPEHNGIVLEVADTGAGIPASKLAKITEPFVQAGNAQSHPGTGTGLGLAITKSLVELHGGELELVSTEHVGTTVTIHLPVALMQRGGNGEATGAPMVNQQAV